MATPYELDNAAWIQQQRQEVVQEGRVWVLTVDGKRVAHSFSRATIDLISNDLSTKGYTEVDSNG